MKNLIGSAKRLCFQIDMSNANIWIIRSGFEVVLNVLNKVPKFVKSLMKSALAIARVSYESHRINAIH